MAGPKYRSVSQLQRKATRRDMLPRVLIVCEGEKTEPNYFRGLVKEWGISSASVEIYHSGSAPSTVVSDAVKRRNEALGKGCKGSKRAKSSDAFEKVFCVFDRDTHATFDDAIKIAQQYEEFILIVSVISFELWFLLHFKYTTASYKDGAQVIDELHKHLPEYTKNQVSLQLLRDERRIEQAMKNAQKLRQVQAENHTSSYPNPWTNVDEVVSYLRKIRLRY